MGGSKPPNSWRKRFGDKKTPSLSSTLPDLQADQYGRQLPSNDDLMLPTQTLYIGCPRSRTRAFRIQNGSLCSSQKPQIRSPSSVKTKWSKLPWQAAPEVRALPSPSAALADMPCRRRRGGHRPDIGPEQAPGHDPGAEGNVCFLVWCANPRLTIASRPRARASTSMASSGFKSTIPIKPRWPMFCEAPTSSCASSQGSTT